MNLKEGREGGILEDLEGGKGKEKCIIILKYKESYELTYLQKYIVEYTF